MDRAYEWWFSSSSSSKNIQPERRAGLREQEASEGEERMKGQEGGKGKREKPIYEEEEPREEMRGG